MQDKRSSTILSRALGTTGLAAALVFGLAGCHHNAAASGQDPADANMASPTGQSTQVLGESSSYSPQQSGESYPEGQQAPAPIVQGNPNQTYPGGYGPDDSAEQAGEEAIEQTNEAPPPLPEYDQPPAPGPDYIWTPGYWAWGPDGYYWVPGAWVEAPYYGALWTPPYWAWSDGYYRFHPGYWGRHVGYYGGIDYGFGYIGVGFFGGYWNGNHFYYNRAVSHVGGGIHDYYDRPVVYNNTHYGAQPSNRVSYNGGRGGLNVRPNASEMAAARERHDPATPAQREVRTAAAQNRGQFFAQNHGRPANAAEAHGFANRGGIAPARGPEPNRAAPENRGAQPNVQMQRNQQMEQQRNVQMQHNQQLQQQRNTQMEQQRNMQMQRERAQPQQRTEAPRPAPQQRVENRPAPQQRMENRPAPQQRMEAPRPAPQPQRMEAPRPAPQQRMENRPAPQQRATPHPAPAPHPDEHPSGGNDHHR